MGQRFLRVSFSAAGVLLKKSTDASDHYLVFADVLVPNSVVLLPALTGWSSWLLVLSLVAAATPVLAVRARRAVARGRPACQIAQRDKAPRIPSETSEAIWARTRGSDSPPGDAR